jgi:hypothetical protein
MTTRETILFLAANPANSTVLRLSEEAREIREELERAGLRDQFVFHERGAVRPKDMSRTLIDLSPTEALAPEPRGITGWLLPPCPRLEADADRSRARRMAPKSRQYDR